MIYTTFGKTELKVSKLGLGCAALGDVYRSVTDEDATHLVNYAIDKGINFFDTSPFYGYTLSEKRLGVALKGRQDEVNLATKGGRFGDDLDSGFDFSYDSIIKMCDESLGRLQTDYLDVYQLHDIEFAKLDVIENEALPALCKLKEEGKVRFIRVTGYPLPLLKHIIDSYDLDVTLSYCYYTLLNQRLNDDLLSSVKAKNMGLINASVTHQGILTQHSPQSWHPAPNTVKEAGQKAAAFCQDQGANLARLAILFAYQNENVDITLLGPRKTEELDSGLEILNSGMDQGLLKAVQEILEPVLNMSWKSGYPEHFEEGAV